MNLEAKKELAKKALKVGKRRIVFSPEGLNEIKEAITKEDIRSLHAEGIITIKPLKGRRKIIKRTTRRGPGKIKFKVKNRKQDYVKNTRKLRKYLKELQRSGIIDKKLYYDCRKKIKMKFFKSKAYLKDYIKRMSVVGTEEKKFGNITKKKGIVSRKRIIKGKK